MPLGFGFDAGPITQSFFNQPPELVDAQTAATRADKFSLVMDNPPPSDQLQNQIANGGEDNLRNQLVLEKTNKDTQNKMKIIRDFAVANNHPMSQEQFDFVMNLSQDQLNNPDTILESEVAKKVFSETLFTDTNPTSDFNKARSMDDATTQAILDVGERQYAKMEIARTQFDKLTQKQKDLGPSTGATLGLGPIVDFVAPWLPFYRNFQQGLVPGTLVGSEMAKQFDEFRQMDTEEFSVKFPQKLQSLVDTGGPQLALEYMQKYFNFSGSDEAWGNVFSILDIASLAAPAAKAIKPLSKLPGNKLPGLVTDGTDDIAIFINRINTQADAELAALNKIKAEAKTPADLAEIQSHINAANAKRKADIKQELAIRDEHLQSLVQTVADVTKAGESDSVSKVAAASGKTDLTVKAETVKSLAEDGQPQDVVRHTPAVMDPNADIRGPVTLPQAQISELTEATRIAEIQTTIDELSNKVKNLQGQMGLERLPPGAENRAIAIAARNLKSELNINNSIARLTYLPLRAEDHFSNVAHIAADITKFDGSTFPSKLSAGAFARNTLKLPSKGYSIEKQGNGYFIRVTRPVNETQTEIRDHLIPTGYETPVRWWSRVAKGRGANQTIGEGQNQARKFALQKVIGIQNAMVDLVKPLAKLGKESVAQLERTLSHLRDQARVTGNNIQGGWANTQGDLDRWWMQANGRYPTIPEAKAYWAWKSAYDASIALENYSAYRSLARQGITDVEVLGQDFFGKVHLDTRPLDSPFEGLLLDDGTAVSYFDQGTLTTPVRSYIDAVVQSGGFKLIQIAQPLARPLRGINGNIINYIVTKTYKNRPLPATIKKYNPASFTKHDYRYQITQPQFNPIQGRNIYMGDTLISTAQTEGDGAYRALQFEEMRDAFRHQDWQRFDNVANSLGLNTVDVLDSFMTGTLHPDHPIGFTPRYIDSIDKPEFRNRFPQHQDARTGSLAALDLDKGSSASLGLENPLHPLDTQQIIDPYVSLSRSIGQMARNGYLQDYQILSAEQFVKEFWDLLDVPRRVLDNNPIPYLLDADNHWMKGADPTRLAAAKNFQQAVKNLLGVQTSTQQVLQQLQGRLYEATYAKFGAKAADIANNAALSKMTNPGGFARGLVYHTKVGLFAIPQFWKQAQTLAVSTAIVGNPATVTKGLSAVMLQDMLRLKPQFVDTFDQWATHFGWGRGHFAELHDLMERSNILSVGKEHAYSPTDLLDPNIVTSGLNKVLSLGATPFSEGEKLTRQFALNAAYLEWRNRVGDFAPLTRRAEMEILKRQDQLNVNMTRASTANIQHNEFMRTWIQFGNYQLRVWELMTGHTLSNAEKLRMFGMQMAMYGFPVAAATTIPWPWFDQYRQEMLQRGHGYVNFFDEIFMKGLPQYGMHMILGKEYDINTQYGAPSVSIFHDTATGNTTLLDQFLGAAGSTAGQIISTTYPLIRDIALIGKPGSMNLIGEDFHDLAKTISGVNYADKLWMAIRLHQTVTKNEVILSNDITNIDGIMMGVFGINPQELDDIAVLNSIKDNETSAKQYASSQIVKYLRQYVKSTDQKDKDINMKAAHMWFVLGDLTPNDFASTVATSMKGYESLFQQLNTQMMLQQVPQSLINQRRSFYTNGNK